MLKTPARRALDDLVQFLADQTPHFGWTIERVRELELSDAQIAIVTEAQPDEFIARLARTAAMLPGYIDALKAPDKSVRMFRLGCIVWAAARVGAENELLYQLETDAARREEEAEFESTVAERDQFEARETFP